MANERTYAETKPRLSLEHRMQMMAHILRLPELLSQALMILKSEQFSATDEPHLRVLWKVVIKICNAGERSALFVHPLQTWSRLSADCRAYLQSHSREIPPEYEEMLFDENKGLLRWMFQELKAEELNQGWGLSLLTQFMEERWVQDPLRDAINDAGEQSISNLDVLMHEAAERKSTIASLGAPECTEVVPSGWEPTSIVKNPTGVDFIDAMIGGGDCPGETYGILGAFKSGKTTLAVQLAAGTARLEYVNSRAAEAKNEAYQKRYAHMFVYEAGANEIRNRVVVHAAKIHKDSIEQWSTPGQGPSSTGKLKEYEHRIFAEEIKQVGLSKVQGEKERFERYTPLMNGICLHDMSGSKERPKQGCHGLPEIAAILEREVRLGHIPIRVIIDYQGLCVTRYMAEHGIPPDREHKLLSTFGYDCMRLIAVPFNCSVWIMHQLSGEANKGTWAKRQTHADAKGTTSFAENLWFCFQLGLPHPKLKAMEFRCGVARRTAVGDPVIVRLDGELGTIRLAPEIIRQDNNLVLRSELPADYDPNEED